MSYREKKTEKKAKPSDEILEVQPIPSFSDGICNVCQLALADHTWGPSGYTEDCNGRPLTFIDKKQSKEFLL
jgi:hypothetical protein